jgi:molybdopterin synthase sulfur carrier subunit
VSTASTGAAPDSLTRVRVALPAHLRDLAGVGSEVQVEVEGEPTVTRVLDALEADHPALRGTIRSHESGARRPFMRYFACGEDVSHEPPNAPLPEAVRSGAEVFRVLGAIAGG